LKARRYPTVSWSMNKGDEYRRNAAILDLDRHRMAEAIAATTAIV
jgi:hypothetical protein